MPKSHFNGRNAWLIKPPGLNRGKGIYIVDSLQDINRIIEQSLSDCSQKMLSNLTNHKGKPSEGPHTRKAHSDFPGPAESRNFIIQKYIESPLLIKKRKFDIRIFVCVTQDMNLYFYREGYLRLSTAKYSLKKLSDDLVHLTNTAIQQQSVEFGKQEDGNQMSFADLRKFLYHEHPTVNFDVDILPKMKYQAIAALQSVRQKINPRNC